MMSVKAETGFRIADGVVVIVLGVLSVVLSWARPVNFWLSILESVFGVLVVAAGVLVLVGRGRSSPLKLTHRRWKYFSLVGFVLLTIVFVTFSASEFARNPTLPLFPTLTGLFLAQLFEAGASQQVRASQLSSRDVGIWKRIMIASAIGAAILGLQAIISALLGGYAVTAFTTPFAVLFLVIAAVIWVMLRARTKQLRNSPDLNR